jgi:hypothetical protein
LLCTTVAFTVSTRTFSAAWIYGPVSGAGNRGRYGNGQVILLADQPVLVVAAEDGKAILLAANPDHHEELGRFQAIDGKTWNHPVIVNGQLYMRNAEEIACYQLKVVRQTSSTIFPSGKIRY